MDKEEFLSLLDDVKKASEILLAEIENKNNAMTIINWIASKLTSIENNIKALEDLKRNQEKS